MPKESAIDLMAKETASKKPIRFGNDVLKLLNKLGKIPNSAKDVFLRDLIQVANAGLYKYRLKCLDKQTIKCTDDSEFVVRIEADKVNNTLSITHKGIGLTKDDLMDEFGCIPKDIVKNYLDTIDTYLMNGDPKDYYSADLDDDYSLGVYSAFMVADRVVITTITTTEPEEEFPAIERKRLLVGVRDQYVCDASATDGFFRLTRFDPKPEDGLIKRGTKVTLYLKNEYLTYLEESKLRELVDKYTFDVCPYPIYVSDDHEREKKRQYTKDREKDLESCKKDFEVLRKLCEQALGSQVEKVVVDDRVFDLPCHFLSDSRTFVINPRSPIMKSLLVDFNKNPDSQRKRKKVMDMFMQHYLLFSAMDYVPDYYYERDDESNDDDDDDDDDESIDDDDYMSIDDDDVASDRVY